VEEQKVVLGRDEILNADDRPIEELPVPEWGGVVLLRGMTGSQRDVIEDLINKEEGKQDLVGIRARVAAQCIVGPEGNRTFSDADVVALGNKSGVALSRVFTRAVELSGFSKKKVEELEGNSKGGRSAASTSD
jgi:hypothetical protein